MGSWAGQMPHLVTSAHLAPRVRCSPLAFGLLPFSCMTAVWGIDDPLLRGDHAESVTVPDPGAPPSIVRHILYLDGAGRSTPYSSTTEDEPTAARFAGKDGRVWHTLVARVQASGLRYISKSELLSLLRGRGKGDAAWPKATEVLRARALAEEWGEHLIDFRPLKGSSATADEVVSTLFTKERP
jgi:hypothetical protein